VSDAAGSDGTVMKYEQERICQFEVVENFKPLQQMANR
jgi:hypothetical protein